MSEYSKDDSDAGPVLLDSIVGDAAIKVDALEGFLNLIATDCKFDDFIREILLIIANSIKSEAGSILEVNKLNQSLFFRAAVGQNIERISDVTIPIGNGIVGHVAESGMPMLVSHASEEKAHLKSVAGLTGFQPKNLVAVPIFIRGRLYGVIELLNRVGESEYSQLDLELLIYLAQLAAKTIEIRMMLNWVKHQEKAA